MAPSRSDLNYKQKLHKDPISPVSDLKSLMNRQRNSIVLQLLKESNTEITLHFEKYLKCLTAFKTSTENGNQDKMSRTFKIAIIYL